MHSLKRTSWFGDPRRARSSNSGQSRAHRLHPLSSVPSPCVEWGGHATLVERLNADERNDCYAPRRSRQRESGSHRRHRWRYACAQTCTSCADACLAEEMVAQLRQCIRLNLDCADVCDAFATLGSRRTGSNEEVIRKLLDACITACRVCGEECQRHASKHEHCRVCADSCRRCETACQSALRTM